MSWLEKFAKRAVGQVNAWLYTEPESASAHIVKARVHLNLGQVDHALRTLDNALAKPSFDDKTKLLGFLKRALPILGAKTERADGSSEEEASKSGEGESEVAPAKTSDDKSSAKDD